MPPDDSSDEDEEPEAAKPRIIEKEEHIGKIVCVESNETKKKAPKENWFPALVVAPTAQDTVRIRIKDEYLVRSFKDGRYYTVPKKEATEFTREQASKQDTAAVQAALEYLHNDCLPAHWDREALFGLGNSSSDFYNEFDSDSSDDEPTEEKDHFVAQLYKYMDDRGTPLNKGPSIINKDVDLYRLYRAVQKLGGYNRVTSQNQWKQIAIRLGFVPTTTSIQNLVKQAYKKFLLPFEEFDRKLGCTMVAHPRANRIKGRSLVRANSVASPKPEKENKSATSAAEESENTSESSIDTAKPLKPKNPSGKVKTLIDRFEEKLEDVKIELKEIIPKEKETKILKDPIEIPSTSATSNRTITKIIKEKEVIPLPLPSTSKSVDVLLTPTARKDKLNKRLTPHTDDKKGRKRIKETDNGKQKPEPVDKDKVDLCTDFPVNVGDKLKVYYHEQKVTYEAKVIEISKQNENPLYLVHYTGWNTRYDEWVPRDRIAENLTNTKTNKRAKNSGKNEARSNSAASEKLSGPSSAIRGSVKRSRGSSRGESQPPRSTTPSSIASNSSRTKSPATPAQRRTTRGQPNALRRTSNNTDISSIQTDSDTDSDEPVKKPTPKRKPSSTKNQANRNSTSEANENKNNSNPSSEEESLASAKGRNFDLNQIRSELKGFKELKTSPSDPDILSNSLVDKKFEYPIKDISDTIPLSEIAKNTSDNKTSSENSSETDSYGDEDSQFSDKTTTLENISEKFQKFVFNKTPAAKSDLVEKMATLKPSGIEKIIKNSLAEKSKALPEKMSMKTLCERSPLKQFDREKEKDLLKDKEKEKEKESEIEKETIDDKKNIAPSFTDTASTSQKLPLESTSVIKCAESTVKIEPIEKSSTKLTFGEKTPSKAFNIKSMHKEKSIIRQSIMSAKDDHQRLSDFDIKSQPSTSAATCDIYEFKEPEPFEFEAAPPKKPSPENDKKGKRKTVLERIEQPPTKATNTLAAKRAKKMIKELEKIKDIKLDDDDQLSSPISSPTALAPIKIESIFDSLRKSPSFNINMANLGQQEECAMLGRDLMSIDEPSTSHMHTDVKPLFISSFVEATPEDTAKIFDLKIGPGESKEELDKELESVKKIMLTEEALNLEPPKVDKPSSIADKVLKALHSQQHSPSTSTEKETIADIKKSPEPVKPPETVVDIKSKFVPVESISTFEPISMIAQPTPAIISKDLETPPTKPVLNSPEHKIDILESIAPKNNDLSETIQKLESVIQKSAELSHLSEDSSDSTDSEQRLVIEDESQSSETQNEFVLNKQANDLPYGLKPATLKDDHGKLISNASSHQLTKDVKIEIFSDKKPQMQQHELSTLSEPIAISKAIIEIDINSSSAKYNQPIEDLTKVEIKLDDISTIKKEDQLAVDNAQNESISLLLCEETIPGSPAPVCPKEQCDNKKNYDCIFASPHPTGLDTKHNSIETDSSASEAKTKNATPGSSPRDSMSQDDSSEENNKKLGKFAHIITPCMSSLNNNYSIFLFFFF